MTVRATPLRRGPAKRAPRVISLHRTRGKAAAMQWGTQLARHEILAFLRRRRDRPFGREDHAHRGSRSSPGNSTCMSASVRAACTGRTGCCTSRRSSAANAHCGARSGTRCPRTTRETSRSRSRSISSPSRTAIAWASASCVASAQVIKERKRGLLAGLWQRMLMIRDILLASWRIYVLLQAWTLRRAVAAPPQAAGVG